MTKYVDAVTGQVLKGLVVYPHLWKEHSTFMIPISPQLPVLFI